MRFIKKAKHSPRFIGPFEILQEAGDIAYRLDSPSKLIVFHLISHISMLK